MIRLALRITALLIAYLCSAVTVGADDDANPAIAAPHKLNDRATLQAIDCWSGVKAASAQNVECYYFYVPMDWENSNSPLIGFPVLVKRSTSPSSDSPVLHLGAGGPGSGMGIDNPEAVDFFLQQYAHFSTELGRDLIVIDPRGSGLATPRLTCQRYVDNEEPRWSQDLSLQEWAEQTRVDYAHCIEASIKQGIDFSGFNSLNVARDAEALRKSLDIKQWVVVGVSHAAIYAQMLIDLAPATVEALVLDSPAFTRLRFHDNFVRQSKYGLELMARYCEINPECREPIPDVETRIWRLVDKFNDNPLELTLPHPYEERNMNVVVNGTRFLDTLHASLYFSVLFEELPGLIQQMENDNPSVFAFFLHYYIGFLLDGLYADLSSISHHCREEALVSDPVLLAQQVAALPDRYRKAAALAWNWQPYCEQMGIAVNMPQSAHSVTQPTLIFQGRWDAITPLHDTLSQLPYFPDHRMLVFPTTHSLIDTEDCMAAIVAQFIADQDSTEDALRSYSRHCNGPISSQVLERTDSNADTAAQ
ncbi:MAG: alpha/beta fold hydrolase [Pseudomonadota bacterium]